MTRTHPDRQAKIFHALKKLDVNYQRCAKCNAFEGNPTDLHTATQILADLYVIPDQETRDEQERAGVWTVGSSNQLRSEFVFIVCKKCGFTTQFDLKILEQHI